MARTSAAKPAAEDASPAAVGKLLALTNLRGRVDSLGREGSASSSSERRARRDFRQASERGVERDWGALFKSKVSGPVKVEEQEAVVWVRRSDCERVTEREELVGRLREGSRLPQYLVDIYQSCSMKERKRRRYLITAMFTGAVVLAR